MGRKTLFNAVFIRPEQIVHFWLCSCKFGALNNIYLCIYRCNLISVLTLHVVIYNIKVA